MTRKTTEFTVVGVPRTPEDRQFLQHIYEARKMYPGLRRYGFAPAEFAQWDSALPPKEMLVDAGKFRYTNIRVATEFFTKMIVPAHEDKRLWWQNIETLGGFVRDVLAHDKAYVTHGLDTLDYSDGELILAAILSGLSITIPPPNDVGSKYAPYIHGTFREGVVLLQKEKRLSINNNFMPAHERYSRVWEYQTYDMQTRERELCRVETEYPVPMKRAYYLAFQSLEGTTKKVSSEYDITPVEDGTWYDYVGELTFLPLETNNDNH